METLTAWCMLCGSPIPMHHRTCPENINRLETELAAERKLSRAISRDCNETALERNDLRDKLVAAEGRALSAEAEMAYQKQRADSAESRLRAVADFAPWQGFAYRAPTPEDSRG